AHSAGIDDTTFVSTVLQQVLKSQANADPASVYLIGFSNGGRMAYRLGCLDPGRWAGVAAVEAVPAATCAATKPVPLVIVANAHDPYFNLSQPGKSIQGYQEPSMQATVDQWRGLDGCANLASLHRLGSTTVQSWDSCRGAGEVSYALYQGSGHSWPAGQAASPSATVLVWALLRHDRLPVIDAAGRPA
ncbi:MAG: alpha/beta hydrolase family esterase, partial [Acidimicrobiales bacterium]